MSKRWPTSAIVMLGVVLAIAVVIPGVVLSSSHAAEVDTVAESDSLNQQAVSLAQIGRYAEAEPLFRRSLAIREKTLGPDHPGVAESLNNLGRLDTELGRYAEAEPLLNRGLTIRQKTLGPDHPDVAKSLNNLAFLYQRQGRQAEAQPLLNLSLAIQVLANLEKRLGPEDSLVAQSLNQLAMLYQSQGRHAEAEPLLKRSLAIREKTLGPTDPEVVESLNNLAELFEAEGRYAEAEPLLKRSLAIGDNVQSRSNLALLYQRQGRQAEAEPLLQRNLADLEATHDSRVAVRDMFKRFNFKSPEDRYQEQSHSAAAKDRALADAELGFKQTADRDHTSAAEGTLAEADSLDEHAFYYIRIGPQALAEPLLQRSLAIREKTLGPENPGIVRSLNNLAGLYQSQGRYAEANPLYERSLAIRQKTLGPTNPAVGESLEYQASSLTQQAVALRQNGHYAEAESLLKRSLAILEQVHGPEHPLVGGSLNNLAELFEAEGRHAEAEPLLKRSLAIQEKALGPIHPGVIPSLESLAALYQNQGRYAEAEPLLKRSLAIREAGYAGNPDLAQTLDKLAALYRNQGRYGEAEPLFMRSLAIREAAYGPEDPRVAESLNNLAALYDDQDRYAEAEGLYKRSLATRETALGPEHPDVAQSLSNLAALYRNQDRYGEALGFSRQAVAIVEKHLGETAAARGSGAETERRSARGYFLQNIALLFADGDANGAAESFRVVQMAEVSSAGAAIAAMATRLAAGAGPQGALIRGRQDLAQQWRDLDGALLKAVSEPKAQRNAAAEAAVRTRIDQTSAKLDALDAQIAAAFPKFADLSNPKPLDASAAQALLAPDEALLVYLTSGKETWLWVLRRDRIALQRIPLGATALAHEVSALRSALDPESNPDLAPFPATKAYAFYQQLLGPAVPLLDGAQNLLVVPDGPLEGLPFSVLLTKPPAHDPQTPADHRDLAWLARDHAVTVLPTVSALRSPVTAVEAPKPFLGIGNPVLNGGSGEARGIKQAALFRGPVADVDEVRRLPSLPETAGELRAIAKTLGASPDDLLLGPQASEPVLRQIALDQYRIVQFATHALVSGDLPGLAEPALVLTPPAKASPDDDGLLTSSKVATLKLNADWVILSACNTAAGDGTPDADGLSGLARAFFYAGARTLLVSNWPVWSKAAVSLTTGTFTALAKDPRIGDAEALRRAEMAMLEPENPPEFAHPLAWAPFVLAGEGGARR